jgi:hypothetical protein
MRDPQKIQPLADQVLQYFLHFGLGKANYLMRSGAQAGEHR